MTDLDGTGVDASASPVDVGSGRGVRARVQSYRLSLLRSVLDGADAPLRYEDAAARLKVADGVGIPLRTLKEPPFADLISKQTPRRGRNGELSGLPWRLRRLSPERLDERGADVEARLRAMRIDLPGTAPFREGGADVTERARIQRVWDMERQIEECGAEHRLAIATNMRARLVARRDEVSARREKGISLAYHELRRTVPSGRTG